jgi:hypothetical protein
VGVRTPRASPCHSGRCVVNDLLLIAFALLLILTLAFDNKDYGHIWRDKEDCHHRR